MLASKIDEFEIVQFPHFMFQASPVVTDFFFKHQANAGNANAKQYPEVLTISAHVALLNDLQPLPSDSQ